jgi:uncharacterized membrane protein YfcA
MELLIVSIASLMAGFVDSIVGGGGLILVPALFAVFRQPIPQPFLGLTRVLPFGARLWPQPSLPAG